MSDQKECFEKNTTYSTSDSGGANLDGYLLDCYETSLSRTIRSIEKTGDKAVKIARLDGLLLGLLLTGLSLLLTVESIPIYPYSISTWIMIGGGIIAIYVSLILSIASYSDQLYYHGPQPSVIREMRNNVQDVDEMERVIYGSYEESIEENDKTLTERTRHIRYSLSFLLFGLLSISCGVLLLITNFPPLIRGGLITSAIILVAGLAVYFYRESQLPIIGPTRENRGEW